MTQEAIDSTKRLFTITAGNLKNNTISVRKHLDFFPPDCFGPAKRSTKNTDGKIELVLEGPKQ